MNVRGPAASAFANPQETDAGKSARGRSTSGLGGRRGQAAPTTEDRLAADASELIGGPAGRRIRFAPPLGPFTGPGFWTPMRVLAVCAVLTFAIGMVQKHPCYADGWFSGANAQYVHACYSDIPHLFQARGFADGFLPYLDRLPEQLSQDLHYLEYPVLTGMFMLVASWITPGGDDIVQREQIFWLVNSGMLMVCLVVAVIAVARTNRGRPFDAIFLALSPAVALNATINWDLFAVALAAVGLLCWSRKRLVWAGVFLGLATAAKLYPALLLGPLLVLCFRAGALRAFGKTAVAAAATWLVVNLPWMVQNPHGWATFYTFSETRGEDYGSFWLVLMQLRDGTPLGALNVGEAAVLILACVGVALLALTAPRRPRVAQLAFLVVAAFALANKVYSPQYVLWLIPLAALARPRWRDLLLWQAGELLYFIGVWAYLSGTVVDDDTKGLPEGAYQLIIVLHILCTLYLAAVIIRDVLRPEHDPVRAPDPGTIDDPGGGLLDGAPDWFTLRRTRR